MCLVYGSKFMVHLVLEERAMPAAAELLSNLLQDGFEALKVELQMPLCKASRPECSIVVCVCGLLGP